MQRLFAYGTLQAAQIIAAVAGAACQGAPARLPDHAAYRVRAADYPGLVPRPGGLVRGVLWEGLDALALRRLDRYEGALYVRARVRVITDAGARLAWAYLIRPRYRGRLSGEAWDPHRPLGAWPFGPRTGA